MRFTIPILATIITLCVLSCPQQGEKPLSAGGEQGLVDLAHTDTTLVIDAKYATAENFVGIQLYPTNRLFILRSTAEKLVRIQARLGREGLGLKIFDGYRPWSVQRKMWESVPDERYVANPEKGSMHNRGCAVDLTLVDHEGRELEMPTDFDDFTEKAHRDYENLPPDVLRNRGKLEEAMVEEGFIPFPTEWWHFHDLGCEENPVLDINPYHEPLPFTRLRE